MYRPGSARPVFFDYNLILITGCQSLFPTLLRKEANMKQTSAGPEAGLFSDKFRYERHRPERTLLYQLVAPVSEQRLSLARNSIE